MVKGRKKPLGKREGKGPARQRILIEQSRCKCGDPGVIARYETIWGVTKHVNRCAVCALLVPQGMIVSMDPPEGFEEPERVQELEEPPPCGVKAFA